MGVPLPPEMSIAVYEVMGFGNGGASVKLYACICKTLRACKQQTKQNKNYYLDIHAENSSSTVQQIMPSEFIWQRIQVMEVLNLYFEAATVQIIS